MIEAITRCNPPGRALPGSWAVPLCAASVE
jgi:hypothetical protein